MITMKENRNIYSVQVHSTVQVREKWIALRRLQERADGTRRNSAESTVRAMLGCLRLYLYGCQHQNKTVIRNVTLGRNTKNLSRYGYEYDDDGWKRLAAAILQLDYETWVFSFSLKIEGAPEIKELLNKISEIRGGTHGDIIISAVRLMYRMIDTQGRLYPHTPTECIGSGFEVCA